MKINWKKFNRTTHYWGSIICALPILIIIGTGTLLLLKKEFNWIQPATVRGMAGAPAVSFDDILKAAISVDQAKIKSWADINRLDVRPGKGVIKVRSENQWEIQLDQNSLKILQVAYRRSDFIESLHDGSYFHDKAKLGVFLPAALILLLLWLTGLYLFLKTVVSKTSAKRRRQEAACVV